MSLETSVAFESTAIVGVAAIDVMSALHFLDENGKIEAPWVQGLWGIHQSTSMAVGATVTAAIVTVTELAATRLENNGRERAAKWTRRGGMIAAGAIALGSHVAIELGASDLSDPKDTVGAVIGIGLGILAGRGVARGMKVFFGWNRQNPIQDMQL